MREITTNFESEGNSSIKKKTEREKILSSNTCAKQNNEC